MNWICLLLLLPVFALACTKPTAPAAGGPQNQSSAVEQPGAVEQQLAQRLKTISDEAQGTVSLSVVHIESGKTISLNGKAQLPRNT